MNTGAKIAIGVGGAGLVCALIYFFYKRSKSATTTSTTGVGNTTTNGGGNTATSPVNGTLAGRPRVGSSTNSSSMPAPTPAPPPPNPALNNDYIIWSYAIYNALLNTNNVSAANDIKTQLVNAWNGTGRIPIYDHKSALDIYPDKSGTFLQPKTTGDVGSGQNAMLRQVFENAATVAGIIAKNNIQGNTHGQAIGHRQGNVDSLLKSIYAADSSPAGIPQLAAALIAVLGYSTSSSVWSQSGYNGGMPNATDLATVMTSVQCCETSSLSCLLSRQAAPASWTATAHRK